MLTDKVILTAYVKYQHNENLNLNDADFLVGSCHRPALETLKNLGIYLRWDGCMSQGLNIYSARGAVLGNITIFANEAWLEELIGDLENLAKDPRKYGLV